MGIKWGDIATGALTGGAGSAIGAGMGLLLEGHNDRRQLRQNEKLLEQQEQANQRMGRFNLEQQLELFKGTGYEAQRKQLEDAGLNVGLLYGKGGSGGTASISSGSVAGGNAPSGGGEAMGGLGMGMQLAQLSLLKAQKENIEADTANKEAGANYTNGPQTQNTNASTANTKADTGLKEQSLKEAVRSMEDRMDIIDAEQQRKRTELDKENRANNMDKATYDARYKQIIAESVAALLQPALIKANTENVKADTTKKGAETTNVQAETKLKDQALMQNIERMIQSWQYLSNDSRKTRIAELIQQNGGGEANGNLLDNIIHMLTTVIK